MSTEPASVRLTMPVIEIQRREGAWVTSEIKHLTLPELYRFAAALGRWIGNPKGNIAAVRIRPLN